RGWRGTERLPRWPARRPARPTPASPGRSRAAPDRPRRRRRPSASRTGTRSAPYATSLPHRKRAGRGPTERFCALDVGSRGSKATATAQNRAGAPAGPHPLMRAVMTNDVCDHVEATASAPDDEGWVAAEIPIESLPRARGEPPRLGPEIVVESPPEL